MCTSSHPNQTLYQVLGIVRSVNCGTVKSHSPIYFCSKDDDKYKDNGAACYGYYIYTKLYLNDQQIVCLNTCVIFGYFFPKKEKDEEPVCDS